MRRRNTSSSSPPEQRSNPGSFTSGGINVCSTHAAINAPKNATTSPQTTIDFVLSRPMVPTIPRYLLAVTALHRLRIAGYLEGGSFLVLLFIAMPLKYLAGQPQAVRIVGMAHGVLFIAYIIFLALAAGDRAWPVGRSLRGLAAAFLPFGPFIFDRSLRAEERSPSQ